MNTSHIIQTGVLTDFVLKYVENATEYVYVEQVVEKAVKTAKVKKADKTAKVEKAVKTAKRQIVEEVIEIKISSDKYI